jgi:DNA oxidative demethylase
MKTENVTVGETTQATLFDTVAVGALARFPRGFSYAEGVLSEAATAEAVALMAGLEFKPFAFRGFAGKRRTVSFGWRYDFNGGGFQPAAPAPDFILRLRERAAAFAEIDPAGLVQSSVIEYAPGAGIGWHSDRPQFGMVVGLSLGAPCRFRMRRRREKRGWDRAALELAPRSAYVLSGESRSLWQHSIPPLAALRYSVTFRTLSPLGESQVKR